MIKFSNFGNIKLKQILIDSTTDIRSNGNQIIIPGFKIEMQVVLCIYCSHKGDLTSESFSLWLKSPKMGDKSQP